MAPRLCFVIMPFATTGSCTEEEWTQFYESVLKPAVEEAGLGYECRRSTAMRGNIVRGIVEDLQSAYVVVADLTDRNANVFYELGVRHSLANRTILLAQRRDDIPFDLHSYANHVYDWRSPEGVTELRSKLTALLDEVDQNPDRPDNPVSDFLGIENRNEASREPWSTHVADLQAQIDGLATQLRSAQINRDIPAASGLDLMLTTVTARPDVDWRLTAHNLARSGDKHTAVALARRTGLALRHDMGETVERLDKPIGKRVDQSEILSVSGDFRTEANRLMEPVESFAMGLAESGWAGAPQIINEIAGQLISESERRTNGLRFAIGLPAYSAWRLLLLSGAAAAFGEHWGVAMRIACEPIEAEDSSGRLSRQPLVERPDLFHPEALLGYGDLAIQAVRSAWETTGISALFISKERFERSLAEVLLLIAIADAAREDGYPLYPGYRLLGRAASNGADALFAALTKNETLSEVAQALGETPDQFRNAWPARRQRMLSAKLGGGYFFSDGPSFPISL